MPTDNKNYSHRVGEGGLALATPKQLKAVRGLALYAVAYPKFIEVWLHHAELVSIIGFKESNRIAYIAPVEAKSDFGGARRRSRPGQDQRRRRSR